MGKIKVYRGIGANTKEELDKYIKEFYDKSIKAQSYGGGSNLGNGIYFTTNKNEVISYSKHNDYGDWKYSHVFEIEIDTDDYLPTDKIDGSKMLELDSEYKQLYDLQRQGLLGDRYHDYIHAEDRALEKYVKTQNKQGVTDGRIYTLQTKRDVPNIFSEDTKESIIKSNYWDNRAIQRLTDVERQSEHYISKVKSIYNQAYHNIDNEIKRVYMNYAKETGLDIQKLKELLSVKETSKTWDNLKRQGLDKYVQDNYKSRISRLEQIQAQIYAKAKQICPKEELQNTMCYKGVINNSYYKTVYDTQMGTGYDFNFAQLDNKVLQVLLNEKWSGKNYSQRIWGNTDILANSLSEIVGGGILSGQSMQKTAKQIRDRFNVGKYYSERLIRTETNHFNNEADALAYDEMGIDKYVFVATLDSRTSLMCKDMDNQVFKYKDRQVGVNYPPLHPNCRSKTRGYLGAEGEKLLQRRARNPITGETEIINNVSYKEWLKQHDVVGVKNGMFRTSNNVFYNTKTLGKLNKGLVETNAKQLNNLLEKYPKISNYIKTRGLTLGGSDSTNAIAYTRWGATFKNIGVYLEKNYYKNPSVYTNTIIRGIKNNNFMPCSERNINKYAITHEFGHVTETYLLHKYSNNNPVEYETALKNQYQWDKYKNRVYNNIKNDIIDIGRKNNPNFDIENQLSNYGKTQPSEFFAECFANMECGKPNELGKAMQEYLKGVM